MCFEHIIQFEHRLRKNNILISDNILTTIGKKKILAEKIDLILFNKILFSHKDILETINFYYLIQILCRYFININFTNER